MTLSDSWDTPPSNPNNRRSSVLQNSMEVDSVGIIAILSMSYVTTHVVKTQTSVAKIPRVPVEKQITTLSVVKFP